MHRHAAILLFGVGALLLSPGAAGVPDAPDVATENMVITPVITGTLGTNGWYTSNVRVSWTFSPEPLETRGCDTRTLTEDTAGTRLSCSATPDLSTWFTVEPTFKIDKTAPTATPAPSPAPNQHGWHRAPLTVSFVATDAMSGPDQPSCTAAQGYSGADTQGHNITGTCKDLAGNTSNPSTYTVRYDTTKPTATPAPSPQPNAHGWHRFPLTVSFIAADVLSGPDQASCTEPQGYSGPDTSSREIVGTCKDFAGNTSSPTIYAIKYDVGQPQASASSRDPDANGWFNHLLRVEFTATDEMSGFDRCDLPKDYSGPDSPATMISGTCFDRAGNSDAASLAFKYDSTAPQVTTAIPSRPPEKGGWYTSPVVFGFQGSDGLAGIEICPSVAYEGPEGEKASVIGSCLDKAGNVGTAAFHLKYDDTAPAVSAAATREPDVNGWYNQSVAVTFAGSDAGAGLASCSAPQNYSGPDTVFAVVTGTCVDNAGNVGLGSLALKYDSSPPLVAGASADRAPDGNGWYNHPLTISFHGSDGASDIDACTVTRYVGPDNPAALLAGSCWDRAGNSSGPRPFAFKYDSAAPTVKELKVKAGNRSAALTWEVSSDATSVEVVRTAGARGAGVTVYRGTGRSFTDTRVANGVRYRYRLTAYDEARNPATREVAATPTAPLLSPQAGAVVSSPPRLLWKTRRGATYYNVQVWRGRRIFSAWPTRRSLKLPREWTYRGRRYRLTPGRYRWYVWPGLGRRAQKKFSPLLGSSSFVVR